MPDIWEDHYGFVPQRTGNAFGTRFCNFHEIFQVIGEWGGQLGGKDQIWLETFAQVHIFPEISQKESG